MLMNQKRFGRITITELCRGAEMERTTFYRHFENIRDVIEYYHLLMARLPQRATMLQSLTALFSWNYDKRENLSILIENRLMEYIARALETSLFSGAVAPP